MKNLFRITYGILLIVVLNACSKATDHSAERFEDEVLICNGEFLVKDTTQSVFIGFVKTLDSEDFRSYSNAIVTLTIESVVFNFSHVANGIYLSDDQIKLEYGDTFIFRIVHEDNIKETTVKIPTPVDMNISYSSPEETINLFFDSANDQYINYKAYFANNNGLDTIWQEAPVSNGNDLIKISSDLSYVELRGVFDDVQYDSIWARLDMQILSSDVGDYLTRLANFQQDYSALSSYSNPPSFFDSEKAYGLIKASAPVKEIIFPISF